MKFYLGIQRSSWANRIDIPFMISAKAMVTSRYSRTVYGEDWLLDSGGFTELSKYGEYRISSSKYLEIVKRTNPTTGAFCQDWMCEPPILKKTGKTIEEHQKATILSYVSLKEKSEKILPVLQGWTLIDYLKHVEGYDSLGLYEGQLFGLGSVCSRSNSNDIELVITGIKREFPDLRLHAFGVKTFALKRRSIIDCLESADSMSWVAKSWREGHSRKGEDYLNYALEWYESIVGGIAETLEYRPSGYLWKKAIGGVVKK